MNLYRLGLLAASFVSAVAAESTFKPARPPALPLAVKSPYLSTWLPAGKNGGNGGYLAGEWPAFWEGQTIGWAGMIRVDGNVYTWMGLPGTETVNQIAYEYTSTKSIFTMDVAGVVQLNVTFLSPITPEDFKRQSLVFSYLNIEVTSLDSESHDVQVYSDISAEWVSGDRNAEVVWDYGITDQEVAYHKIQRKTQLLFSETKDQAEWGSWYWGMHNGTGLTHQSGRDTEVRDAFSRNGELTNNHDSDFRAISNNWPVFAFAVDLGSVGSETVDRLFTIGLDQQDAIQYSGATGDRAVPSLWRSYFQHGLDALDFFYHDYETANQISSDFDDRVARDSIAAAGQDYLTITSLSARQVFGATQLCGNINEPYLFMKEISSNGNMNTVDVIFPAHPIFLYTNPELLLLLLKPLYEIQESGNYPNAYAMHDIGSHYPNATGHPDGNDEPMPLEECGNMVIMALAYALKSGNMTYLDDHYNVLHQWTNYLVQDALYPANQISTDDFAGSLANQTNLALKGIIGIEAMANISSITDHPEDAENRTTVAHDYIDNWQTLGIAYNADPAHTTLSYGDSESHGLLYNLYADKELGLNLVPQSVYDMQSEFYPTVEAKYGVPLDTRHTLTKGDWEMFAASIASTETRDMFMKDLATWISETPTDHALTDLYDTETGDHPEVTFIARPVMGGAFALLLLQQGL